MSGRPDYDDAPQFERTPQTKHGHGSARAANKGRVKRALKSQRMTWKHRRSK